MKLGAHVVLFLLATVALAHPGGGIVALSENSMVFADPTENILWRLDPGAEPKRILSRFHGHWLTRGLDGELYAEAFQESGGAWSSAAFRLDLATAKLTEIAHRDDLGALAFAVDRDGALVFQRGPLLVARRHGGEIPFRPRAGQPVLTNVTAYAWGAGGGLYYADRSQVRRVDPDGNTDLVASFTGQVLEPKIWNATDTPSIFGLAVDDAGAVLAAVPDLGKIYRVGKDGVPVEIPSSKDGWRATGVSALAGSVFLLESDPRASTSPRVRILRPDGRTEILTVPRPVRPSQ